MSERSFFYGRIIKEIKTGMSYFINPQTGRRMYNDLSNVGMTVNKVLERSLCVVLFTVPKEVSI